MRTRYDDIWRVMLYYVWHDVVMGSLLLGRETRKSSIIRTPIHHSLMFAGELYIYIDYRIQIRKS